MRRLPRLVLYAVFALTGFSALTLQVVWQRVMALHSGVDLVSFTTVVAAFLAGLGLGSLAGGRLADRLGPRRSLLAFAGSNVLIGAFAWVSIWLLYDFYEAHAGSLTNADSKFAFNVAVLLVPTVLMGLSLPLVAKGVVGRVRDAGPLVGRLYSINTLGAAAGAAVTGWVLLGTYGFVATARMAGTLNLIAAFLVVVSTRGQLRATSEAVATGALDGVGGTDGPAGKVAPGGADPIGEPHGGVAGSSRPVWPWYVVYALTGAVALGFEIVFFRTIDGVMRSNSYSFAHVLATYLVFFGTGAAVGSVVVRRTTRPDRWFLWLQFAVGVSALAGVVVLTRVLPHSPWSATIARYFTGDGFDFGFRNANGALNKAFIPVFFGVPLIVLSVPVFCMGASFPCAQALVSDRLTTLGRHTGLLQFANIVGNVAGTLVVGFVLVDRLGTSGTYRVLALALLIPGLGAAYLARSRRLRAGLVVGAVATALLAVVVFPSNVRLWAHLNGVPTNDLVLAEDRSCATALKHVDDQWVLTVNGASQNNYPFDDLHVLIGMMPTMLHPDPVSGMALGLGIGATPYGLSVDPRLEQIDTVEICGGEIALLRGLARGGAPELDRFFADPRQHLLVGDGRDHLLRTDKRYDVVVVDTLRPQAGFSGSLYSKEFYELVRAHLNEGGMMAQWAPTPRVVNTITEVFPHVVRFTVPQYQNSTFVVASDSPIDVDPASLIDRFDRVRDAFGAQQAASLGAYLSDVQVQCLADGGPIPPAPPGSVNSDLAPLDEYFVNNTDNVVERAPSCGDRS